MFRNKMILGLAFVVSLGLMIDSVQGAWWQFWKKEVKTETKTVMGKKPAQEPAVIKAEAKKTSEVAKAESKPAKVEVAGQKGTPTVEAKEVESIMEWQFDEEIVNIIFGEAEMTVKQARTLGMKGLEQRKGTEMVKMQYPRVIVTERAVKFLDERGKTKRKVVLNEENWEMPVYSLKSLEKGKLVISGEVGEHIETTYNYVRWIDEQGKVIKETKGGDQIFGEKISGDGRYVLVGCLGWNCILYDIDGNKLWEKKGDFRELDILYDGKVLILEEPLEATRTKISMIGPNGSTVWEKYLVSGSTYEVFSTKDGKVIVYVTTDIYKDGKPTVDDEYTLYAFDQEGNLLWSPKRYRGFDQSFPVLILSKESHFLCGARRGGYLWAMDINGGDILWERNLEEISTKAKEIEYFDPSYQVSPNGKYLLVKGTLLLDVKTGTLLRQIEHGKMKFLDSDKIWRVRDNRVEIFNIPDILR